MMRKKHIQILSRCKFAFADIAELAELDTILRERTRRFAEKPLKLLTLFLLFLVIGYTPAMANNIQIANGEVVRVGANRFIEFDLSWENSWRHPFSTGINNWDAAWVFAKFRIGGSDPTFNNVTLTNGSNTFTLPSVAALRVGMPVWQVDGSYIAGAVETSFDPVITAINTSTNEVTISVNVTIATASNYTLSFSRIWEHAWLSTNDNDHNPGTGTAATITTGNTEIDGTNRGMGAFIYRSAPGLGPFGISGARLRWNFTDQNVPPTLPVEIRIFGIEMVYVPQGSFFVGSGGTEAGSLTAAPWTSGATTPFRITSENVLTLGGNSAGNLRNSNVSMWGGGDDFNNSTATTLPAAFPKGYLAFYVLKYLITQQQYVDFLNTLTRAQQANRISAVTAGRFAGSTDVHDAPQSRNGVRVMSDPGADLPRIYGCDLNANAVAGESDDGQWIPMGWISWMDGAAYLDWAGLRPMTELEYEKAARGPINSVPNEYAWGNALLNPNRYTLSSPGTASEAIATNYSIADGNANYLNSRPDAHQGPIRSGIFSTGSSNRMQAGASYWGIMELTGNLWDRSVTLGNNAGRSYTGRHGNGALFGPGGDADVDFWPGINGGGTGCSNGDARSCGENTEFAGTTGVTHAAGSGLGHGGGWQNNANQIRVSDRTAATWTSIARSNNNGFRGVRTAGCSFDPGIPDVPQVLEDVTEVMPNRMITLTTNLSGHTGGYFWTFTSGDWKLIAGQGTSQVKVLVGTEPAVLSVGAVNDCGTGPYRTVSLTSEVRATGGDEIFSYIADGTNGEAGKKYIVHIFRTPGSHTFEPREAITSVDYLIVAGGGGGGGIANPGQEGSGGGGAGGLLTSFATPEGGTGVLSLSATPYSITVGAGGEARTQGGNSTAFDLTAVGGGFGGSNGSGLGIGGNGGSGGGGSGHAGAKAGGTGIAGPPRQGHNGGTGPHITNLSGGGGGAGSAGNSEALGGEGLTYNITGSHVTYAAGGNGGTFNQGAASNTIGGGGGGGGRSGGANNLGTPGKDGVVIIRYKAIEN